VDGAIHRAAGPALLDYCKTLNGCETGEARLTPGFLLEARFIIHTVGPVWQGGNRGEAEKLSSCYRNSLRLARENNLKSIAFPAISCGVYAYPLVQAAQIAVDEICGFVEMNTGLEEVYLVAFGEPMEDILRQALAGR